MYGDDKANVTLVLCSLWRRWHGVPDQKGNAGRDLKEVTIDGGGSGNVRIIIV